MVIIDNITNHNNPTATEETIATSEGIIAMSHNQIPLSPASAAGSSVVGNNHAFFPSSQATPDHANANAMLAARKQQLAHLQTLQRQQQQVLQQMSNRSAASAAVQAQQQQLQQGGVGLSPMGGMSAMGPNGGYGGGSAPGGYAVPQSQDGRDDRFSASGLRSHPGSPVASQVAPGSQVGAPGAAAVAPGSVVSFNQNKFRAPPAPAPSSAAPSPRQQHQHQQHQHQRAYECDYDTNPTELYLSVQRKDWEGAAERAATHPHEAGTWVSRKESDGKLRWRLLPLHAAIIFRAPERTVGALLFAFARGAACKDDQGMLPLHLGFRNGCEGAVVDLLLMAYPQSVDVRDRKGRTPMVLAQQSGHPNRDLYVRALERGPAYYAVAGAAKSGIVPNTPESVATPVMMGGQQQEAPRQIQQVQQVQQVQHQQQQMQVQEQQMQMQMQQQRVQQAQQQQVPVMPPAGTNGAWPSNFMGALMPAQQQPPPSTPAQHQQQQPHPPSTAGGSMDDKAAALPAPMLLPALTNEAAPTDEPQPSYDANAASNVAPNPAANGQDDLRLSELEAELAKTQETSQVLVDHVNSLEAQLASRSDTERFLATKIANLDSQLKEANAKLEAGTAEIEAGRAALGKKDTEGDERTKNAEEEVKRLEVALADKKESELRSYKLTNKERFDLEGKVESSERESAASQANAAVLEAQLKKKIETEQSLASQVSMLASQLASSASSSSEAASSYQRKCESLQNENRRLGSHIEELEGKLGTVAAALDAMAAEQERIVEAATKHEKTMAACARAHQTIIHDTTRQEVLLEDAAKEREQIVSILMRQAEDAERTMADRERVLEAVKVQEEDIVRGAQERDDVVDSVNKQREYMDFMLNGELQFLKRTKSEDECELVNERKTEDMERMKAEYDAERSEEVGQMKANAEDQMEQIRAAADAEAEGTAAAALVAAIAADEGLEIPRVEDQAAIVAAVFNPNWGMDDMDMEESVVEIEAEEVPVVKGTTAGGEVAIAEEPADIAIAAEEDATKPKEDEQATATEKEEEEPTTIEEDPTQEISNVASAVEAALRLQMGAGGDDSDEEEEEEVNPKINHEDIEDIDDAALEEAANVIKDAMKAAENLIEQDDDDDSDDDDVEIYVAPDVLLVASADDDDDDDDVDEEVKSPKAVAGDDEHAGYETPASQEEDDDDEAIDAAIAAAMSDVDSVVSVDPLHK